MHISLKHPSGWCDCWRQLLTKSFPRSTFQWRSKPGCLHPSIIRASSGNLWVLWILIPPTAQTGIASQTEKCQFIRLCGLGCTASRRRCSSVFTRSWPDSVMLLKHHGLFYSRVNLGVAWVVTVRTASKSSRRWAHLLKWKCRLVPTASVANTSKQTFFWKIVWSRAKQIRAQIFTSICNLSVPL